MKVKYLAKPVKQKAGYMLKVIKNETENQELVRIERNKDVKKDLREKDRFQLNDILHVIQ